MKFTLLFVYVKAKDIYQRMEGLGLANRKKPMWIFPCVSSLKTNNQLKTKIVT